MLVLVLVRLVLLLLAGVGGGRGGVAHPVRGSVLLYFTLLTYYSLLGPHAGLGVAWVSDKWEWELEGGGLGWVGIDIKDSSLPLFLTSFPFLSFRLCSCNLI